MDPRAKRHGILGLPSFLGASVFVQAAINIGAWSLLVYVPVVMLALFGYIALYNWLIPSEPATWRGLVLPGISIIFFQVAFWVLLFMSLNWWRSSHGT